MGCIVGGRLLKEIESLNRELKIIEGILETAELRKKELTEDIRDLTIEARHEFN